jgi:FKBP-type peptidyl-prolyl cis-trans isomerase FkpA
MVHRCLTKRLTMLKRSRPALCVLLLWPLLASGCVTPPSFSPGPADPDAPTEFTQTESGLRYRILRRGTGPRPTATDTVKVHYSGSLEDGRVFDSSYRRGKPETFALSSLIAGWAEGLQLVQQGGMIELEIPPDLGYGAQGAGGSIPPGATLHFTVELLDIR